LTIFNFIYVKIAIFNNQRQVLAATNSMHVYLW